MADDHVMALARKALEGDPAALVRCMGEVARRSGSSGGVRTIVMPAPRPKPTPKIEGDTGYRDEKPLYDRVWVTPGLSQVRFSSAPMGSADPNVPNGLMRAKTRADTCYVTSARLPEPESFDVTALTLIPEGLPGEEVRPEFVRWLRQETWFTVNVGGYMIRNELPSVLLVRSQTAIEHVPLEDDEEPVFGAPALHLDRPIFFGINYCHYFELSASTPWDGPPQRVRIVADGWHYNVDVRRADGTSLMREAS